MKAKLVYTILFIVCCNAIMFVLCALPWCGALLVNGWFVLLAIPGTLFGSFVCHEMFFNIENTPDDEEFDYTDLLD